MIAGYRIRSPLAVGGMGRVYRACGPHGEEVALKLLKPDLARDQVVRRRFSREARIAQRITDPHVVPVLDVGEHAGTPFMVQTFIRGGSLDAKIADEGVLDLEPLVTLVLQVADGLDALHTAGLVHRDVKPGNILLDEQLEKNPADRPQRASDYARLLATAAGVEPQPAS